MYRIHDPVNARIIANGFVLGIDEDYLKILVRGVLVDPV